MKRQENRRTLVANVSLLAILIAVGFLIWDRDRNAKDDHPLPNVNVSQPNAQDQPTLYPVTIIIVDDFTFSTPLNSLVKRIVDEGGG